LQPPEFLGHIRPRGGAFGVDYREATNVDRLWKP
jgi:hypothetical protein